MGTWIFRSTPFSTGFETTRNLRILKPLAVAAGIALAFFAGTLSPSQREKPQAAAVLFDSEDAIWKGDQKSRNFGAPFQKGESYELESGVARLAFATGAGLAIEGPARMKVVNANRVEIFEGKIAAYVPDEAIGFVVATPGMNIVDLGTKFGIEVKPGGGSEVHVFEGQVEVERDNGRRLIEAGEALRYDKGHTGEPTIIAARESDFAEPPSLEQLLSIGGRRDIENSKQNRISLEALRSHSKLLVFENFGIPPGEIDGQKGALGFGKRGWRASRLHTQVVGLSGGKKTGGGRLLIRGRQVSEPNALNRVASPLEAPLPLNFFLAIEGRYEGLDDDDFFGFWVDSSDRQDSSHSHSPTFGIREGKFFARVGLADTAIGPPAITGETFVLVAEVIRNPEQGVATVKLWVNGNPVAEVTAPCVWMTKSFSQLGIRMGKATDVSDKLIVDKIAVGTSLEAVLIRP